MTLSPVDVRRDLSPSTDLTAPALPVSLEFAPDVPATVRARVSYAFRVFAAIYGHAVPDIPQSGAIHCFYGRTPPGNVRAFYIPALYRPDDNPQKQWNFQQCRYAGQDFHLSLGKDPATEKPDWLGEIFQWLSSSYESAITKRDSVGRIPYSETVFCRENISPRIPHVTLLMAWLENAIRGAAAREALPKAPSPLPGVDHMVVSSHDIDFYFVARISAAKRLVKNLGIAVALYRNPAFFAENLQMLLKLLAGGRVGDYLPRLLDAIEQHGFRSTLFVVARQGHKRDPNYRLDHLAGYLTESANRGFSVGLHGSYRSVIEDQSLPSEAACFQNQVGQAVYASRQHWLRFDHHKNLFAQLQRSGVACDSTLGFPDSIGFRNGASFAFPPYDFETERPHDFLEIPLALMDGSLEATSRTLRRPPQALAEAVLAASREYAWGGISVLWHNPIEPLSVPSAINRVFWRCASQQGELKEKWMSAGQFLAACLPRYQQAGLLKGISCHG